MTRATRKPSPISVNVVLLDPAWTKVLPGVETAGAQGRARRRRQAQAIAHRRLGRRQARARLERARPQEGQADQRAVLSLGRARFLGDVVLARQTVWREARQQRKTPSDHVSHLVVHGTLHLLGHDHETGEADAERMEALERRILETARDRRSLLGRRALAALKHLERLLALGRREGAVELGQQLRRELDVERGEILLHALAARRFGNGDDAGLGQQPGERQLGRRAARPRRRAS